MGKIHSNEERKWHHAYGDVISKLPDSLITHILTYLPTKQAIRTSSLSSRWETLWLSIPGLDLNSRDFPNYDAFVSFMDKLIDFSKEEKSCWHKVKLCLRKYDFDQTCVTRWLDCLATCKLQHLDLECDLVRHDYLEGVPLSLYACETLVYLRLHRVWLGLFESSVSLPCLKTMILEKNEYENDACLETIISSCPVLEDLSIVRSAKDNVKNLRVRSRTLISLVVGFDFGENRSALSGFVTKNSWLLIDAPRLKCLEADFFSTAAEFLPEILQCCPNLKSIILDLSLSDLSSQVNSANVPQCLLSSLEFVEIKSRFRGNFDDLVVASYFVENSIILEKLLVHLNSSEEKKCLVALRRLLALPKPSSMCKIVYVTDS